MSSSVVAVIDIGSNSIKSLVATRGPDGNLTVLATRTIDARISAGISKATPRLSEEGMTRGLDAIRTLLADIAPLAPSRIVLVATSAVRDAQNGREFRERVRTTTGHDIRILTGDEEAGLIGRGLTCDPALADLRDFYVFDLGGGSLECLAFRDRRIEQAVSLQLGCVRLTERFVRHTAGPLAAESVAAIRQHVTDTLHNDRFSFSLPRDTAVVGTGGTLTTVRAIQAARAGAGLETIDTRISVDRMRELANELEALPLAARRNIGGLPPARADVFPTALITLVALADLGGFSAFQHSFYNLRFGLVAEALSSG